MIPRESLGATNNSSEVDHFFRSPKYLTVSSQLHLEAYAAELGSVWTLTPVFRAEKSDTPRHLSEFYMLEAEAYFMYTLDTLTDLVEDLIRDLVRRLYNTPVAQEILTVRRTGESGPEDRPDEGLRQRWLDLMDERRWKRITYTNAIEMLQDAAEKRGARFEYPPTWSGGLQLEHEKYIVEVICRNKPVFVTDYPRSVKPFYMAPSHSEGFEDGRETVACFDLLLPEVSEVAGGSLREHRLEHIIQNMRENGLVKQREMPSSQQSSSSSFPQEDASKAEAEDLAEALYPGLRPHEDLVHLRWYTDLRRWGSAPHGGFGLGFDRFLGYLAGVSSLRDVVAFPRYFGRAEC